MLAKFTACWISSLKLFFNQMSKIFVHVILRVIYVCSSTTKSPELKKSLSSFNIFSNDGSFLDQFKQIKEKKMDQKLKSFKRER